jgi:hypothetical protein
MLRTWGLVNPSRLRPVPPQRHLAVTLTAAIAAALIAPAAAPAAVTVGQTAPGSPDTVGLTTLWAQAAAGSPSYEIPAAGVITSWSATGGSSQGQMKLKVVRKAPPNTYTIVGEDTQRTISPGVLNTFNARIPVAGGELLALWVVGSGPSTFDTGNPGDIVEFGLGNLPEPPVGQNFLMDANANNSRVNVSANVEPDCDRDGFGDETQDPDTRSCNPDRSLILDTNKGKVEKGRRVVVSGQIDAALNEAECESNQTVELERKGKDDPNSAFKTFRTVHSEATGNFDTRVTLRETRIFRAVARETAACDREVSNTKKVRVQSKHAAQEA